MARVPRNLCGGGGRANGGTDDGRTEDALYLFCFFPLPPYNAHILPPPPSLLPLRTARKEEESEQEKEGFANWENMQHQNNFPPIYLCILSLKVCFHIVLTGGTAIPAPLFHLMFLPMGQGKTTTGGQLSRSPPSPPFLSFFPLLDRRCHPLYCFLLVPPPQLS